MKRIHLSICLAISLILVAMTMPCIAADTVNADSLQKAIDSAVDAVKPGLVRIHVVSGEDRDGREVKEEGFGSGAIISPDGYVITNHHVAGHARQITCTLSDRTEVDAKLIGTDALGDIAVIKLIGDAKRTFPVVKFGDSSTLRVGDRILAMGCPLALSQSVTMGIVSNTELIASPIFGTGGMIMDGEDVGSIVRWIGHDAQIFPGNSGGPLVNMQGEIVGINEVSMGLGGAIPGNLARDIATELIKNGKIRRAWIGIVAQPLLKSSKYDKGVLVASTIDGSPAQKAGFQPGDILTKLDGKDVSVRFAEEKPVFNRLCMSLPIGKEVEAAVIRGDKEMTLKVTPTDRADAQAKAEELKEWGITASNLTLFAAKQQKRSETAGVLVTSVRPGGPAGDAKPDMDADDIILKVGTHSVGNLDDLRKVTREITAGKGEPVPTLVTFEREGKQFLTVVKVGVQDMKDPGLEVSKAWLPVSTQVLTRDIADALGIGDRTGVRVTQVFPNAAADKAGFKIGDIIVSIDGTAIPASQPEDTDVFPMMVRQYKIGSTAEFTLLRDGKEMKISVALPSSPKLPREMKKYQDENFDFVARDLAFLDRVGEHWPETQQGVLVESVGMGGWASLGGLSGDDLIESVNGKPVADLAGFQSIMEKISAEKPKTVVLQVKRGIADQYVEIEPVWPAN